MAKIQITIRTRSQNGMLYDRMRSFIPASITCIRETGYQKWQDAAAFLHESIDKTDDILLVLDEDAFITDWTAVRSLCEFVKKNNYSHAGVPDGGAIEHRTHSYININPFIAIFNCGVINPVKSKTGRSAIDQISYSEEMNEWKPDWITGNYTHDSIEPYAGLFYWLARVGKPLFLKASTLWDGISTRVAGINGETICLHSWYSRSYETDHVTKTRIDSIYRAAQKVKKNNS